MNKTMCIILGGVLVCAFTAGYLRFTMQTSTPAIDHQGALQQKRQPVQASVKKTERSKPAVRLATPAKTIKGPTVQVPDPVVSQQYDALWQQIRRVHQHQLDQERHERELTRKIVNLQKIIRSGQAKALENGTELSTLRGRVEIMESDLGRVRSMNQNLTGKVGQHMIRTPDAEQKIEGLKKSLSASRFRVMELSSQVGSVEMEHGILRDQLTDAATVSVRLAEEQQQRIAQDTVKEQLVVLDGQVEAKLHEIKNLQASLQDARQQEQRIGAQIENVKVHLGVIRGAQISRKQDRLDLDDDDPRKEKLAQEEQRLQQELQQGQAKLETLQAASWHEFGISKNATGKLKQLLAQAEQELQQLIALDAQHTSAFAQRTGMTLEIEKQADQASDALVLVDTQKQRILDLKSRAAPLERKLSRVKGEHALLLATSDSDKDGVFDNTDLCSKTPPGSKVDKRGCEFDQDRDGLVDRLDLCPASPIGSRVTVLGCGPKARLILRGVSFEVGTARLEPDAMDNLARVAQILKKAPNIRLEIAGYTDSQGKPQKNMRISRERALAVYTYLTQQGGIAARRLMARGYGEADPVDDNGKRDGRARNRRVELHLQPPG